MRFMNSNYGYADFGKPENRARVEAARKANRNKNVTAAVLQEPGGKLAPVKRDFQPKQSSRPGYKSQSKALRDMFAPPQIREPGFARNARSTAAGVSQGSRDLFRTQGKAGVKAKSTVAGLKQSGRDAAYAGGQMLRKAGKFAKNNKVGVGLAAAGALGAVGYGVYRKMRSDKGKKRGSYQ